MNTISVACPDWLAELIEGAGGTIRFSKFMNWALNDPSNGSYASGKLRIGTKGDFVTSPSLGPEFSELLGLQIAEWIKELDSKSLSKNKISLVDIGPGEGDLVFHLLSFFKKKFPQLLHKIDLAMVEINEGMKDRQKRKLKAFSYVSIRWVSLDEISQSPLVGIFIAHELLDALPVDILVCENNQLYLQGIKLERSSNKNFISYTKLPLPKEIKYELEFLKEQANIFIPPYNAPAKWRTEWHVSLDPWFSKVSSSIKNGKLLVIDYVLEASRYFHPSRSEGTLISYKDQKAYYDILENAGFRDITAHLCLETLIRSANKAELTFVGERKQGLALLALGLSKKLTMLREGQMSNLNNTLRTRENLLRLIDPITLGNFSWILFSKNLDSINTSFLSNPSE